MGVNKLMVKNRTSTTYVRGGVVNVAPLSLSAGENPSSGTKGSVTAIVAVRMENAAPRADVI
jgi:hypothetical protein